MIAGPIWLIGCGNMGGAMLKGWIADGIAPDRITVVDPSPVALPEGVRHFASIPVGEPKPCLVLLAIKPQILEAAAPDIAPALGENTILLSILAGVESPRLRSLFPAPGRIVRAMPNTPAGIGKGVTVVCSDQPDAALEQLLRPLGLVEWISHEEQFHAVIAVSGSGPAFVFRYIEAVTKAGLTLGLPESTARRLAEATVEGSAALASQSQDSLHDLAEKVRSPGGTTNAGLLSLDESEFSNSIARFMQATFDRSVEMTHES